MVESITPCAPERGLGVTRPSADILAIGDNADVKMFGSRMDDSEHAAQEYLRSCGFQDPVYEPNGRVPPDFLVEGRIAVEVRRLNQMPDPKGPGLEQIQRSLQTKVPLLLKGIGPSGARDSWFVFLRFKRPLPPWRKLRIRIGQELRAFAQDATRWIEDHHEIKIDKNFCIRLSRAGNAHSELFVFAGYSDFDASGFIVPKLEQNMSICIRQKTDAIAPFRPRYAEWWLMLVDHIAYAAIRNRDLDLLRNRLHGLADWDRVVLVSPIDHTRGLQIWPPVGQ